MGETCVISQLCQAQAKCSLRQTLLAPWKFLGGKKNYENDLDDLLFVVFPASRKSESITSSSYT